MRYLELFTSPCDASFHELCAQHTAVRLDHALRPNVVVVGRDLDVGETLDSGSGKLVNLGRLQATSSRGRSAE
jgi:hypothetical protein